MKYLGRFLILIAIAYFVGWLIAQYLKGELG